MKYIIIIFHIVCNGSYNLVSIEVLSACTHFNQARGGKTSGDENKEGEKRGGGTKEEDRREEKERRNEEEIEVKGTGRGSRKRKMGVKKKDGKAAKLTPNCESSEVAFRA